MGGRAYRQSYLLQVAGSAGGKSWEAEVIRGNEHVRARIQAAFRLFAERLPTGCLHPIP